MREETKVLIEIVAKKRSEQILKATSGVEASLTLDESGLRGALQVMKGGELEHIEFIESKDTAGKVQYFEDYSEVAKSTGSLIILFPESKYSRDTASAIYQGIVKDIRRGTGAEVRFQGFVYDDMGNIKIVH